MLLKFHTLDEPQIRRDRLGNKIPNKKTKTRSKMASDHKVTWSDEIRTKVENSGIQTLEH